MIRTPYGFERHISATASLKIFEMSVCQRKKRFDGTEIRLVWHADKDNAKPEVKIGKGEAMAEVRTVKGETT